MKLLISFLMIFQMICTNVEFYGKSYIVYDSLNQYVVEGRNIDYLQSVASISKIMTAIVVIENSRLDVLADGQLADRDNALGLESDVNEHLVMLDLNDSAVNEIALIKVGNRTVDEVVHLLLVDIVKRENGRVLNLTQRWTPFELRGPDC